MNRHVDQQADEDEEVGAIINCILNKSGFNLPNNGECSRTCIGLHEGQQQPEQSYRGKTKSTHTKMHCFSSQLKVQYSTVKWDVRSSPCKKLGCPVHNSPKHWQDTIRDVTPGLYAHIC